MILIGNVNQHFASAGRLLKPRLRNIVASGRFDRVMLTQSYPLENLVAACDLFANQRGGVLKIAIKPQVGESPGRSCQCGSHAPHHILAGLLTGLKQFDERTRTVAQPDAVTLGLNDNLGVGLALCLSGLVRNDGGIQCCDGSRYLTHRDDALAGRFFAHNGQHLFAVALQHDDIRGRLRLEFVDHD
jgi:hypothetical protein